MEARQEILNKAYDLAYSYEAERGSCPQCVLSALFNTLHIGDKQTIKAADVLAGGTALSAKGTCGALAGGLMTLSAIAGREFDDFMDGKRDRKVFEFAEILYKKFLKEYGAPLCCDVHKKLFGRTFNLMDPKEYDEFDKAGAHIDKCPSVCGNVAKWTAEIILDNFDIKKLQ